MKTWFSFRNICLYASILISSASSSEGGSILMNVRTLFYQTRDERYNVDISLNDVLSIVWLCHSTDTSDSTRSEVRKSRFLIYIYIIKLKPLTFGEEKIYCSIPRKMHFCETLCRIALDGQTAKNVRRFACNAIVGLIFYTPKSHKIKDINFWSWTNGYFNCSHPTSSSSILKRRKPSLENYA